MQESRHAIVYIDGFNLYFGLKAASFRRFYWLNVHRLATRLVANRGTLSVVKYFTSRIWGTAAKTGARCTHADHVEAEAKRQRQTAYLDALGSVSAVRIYYGKYFLQRRVCPACGNAVMQPTEKMTDVNIATELLLDASSDAFETAILVSGDSDLCAPVRAVKCRWPDKRIVVAFPPKRISKDLQKAASAYFVIGHGNLAASQFPDEVRTGDGHTVRRPGKWR